MTIRDESIRQWFVENMVNYDFDKDQRREPTLHNLLKDEIVVKASKELDGRRSDITPAPENEKDDWYNIKFVFKDQSRQTGVDLISTWVYIIETYDDVNLKLVLVDFNVKNKSNEE